MLSHFHMGHESHVTDSKPRRLHADQAYDASHLRKWLRAHTSTSGIARKGIESSERFGRRRWVIDRTVSWLSPATDGSTTATNVIPWTSSHLPQPSAQTQDSADLRS